MDFELSGMKLRVNNEGIFVKEENEKEAVVENPYTSASTEEKENQE